MQERRACFTFFDIKEELDVVTVSHVSGTHGIRASDSFFEAIDEVVLQETRAKAVKHV